MTISGNETYTYTVDGGTQTHTSQYEVKVPIVAGDGISIGAKTDNTGIVITNSDHDTLAGKLDKETALTTYPQAYIKKQHGEQTMFSVTSAVAADTIMNRDSNGRASVAGPTDDSHIANKTYVDTADAKKLDKKTTTGYFAYTHDGSTQAELKISQSNDASTLVQRNSAGQITATAPTNTTHCTTKKYVDDAMSGKQDTLVSGKNIKTINGQNILGSGNIEIQGGGSNIPAVRITNGFSGDISDNESFKILEDVYRNRKFSLVYQEVDNGSFIYYSYSGQKLAGDNMGHIYFSYTDDYNGTLSSIDYNVESGHWIKYEMSMIKTEEIPNNGPTDDNGNPIPGVSVGTYQTGGSTVVDIITISLVIQIPYSQDTVIQCVVPSNLFGFPAPYSDEYTPTMFGNPSIIEMPSSPWVIKTINVQWNEINTTLRFHMGQGSGNGVGIFRINFRL